MSTYGGPVQPARRRFLGAAGVVLAILIAIAALILAIVALNKEAPASAAPSASPNQQAPSPDADRKLCEAIAPLMKENDDRSNAFLATGQPGSPEQDAALPKFVTDTQDWARRTQQVLDAKANPPRLLTRSLQRYIDDMQLFVAKIGRAHV